MHKIWFKMKDYKPLVMTEIYCFSDIEYTLKGGDILDIKPNDPYKEIEDYIYVENVSSIIYKIKIDKPYEKIYQKILQKSSIAPHLLFNSKEIEFEYNLNTPYRSILFIGSLLRYLEESPNNTMEALNEQEVKNTVNNSKFKKETADLLLAYISSKVENAGHRVFTPNKAFAGDHSFFKEYISECLLTRKEAPFTCDHMPSSFIIERINKKDSSQYYYSGDDIKFPSFTHFKNFIISGEIKDESPSPW